MKRLTLLPALALASVSLACGNGEVRTATPTSTPSPSAVASTTHTASSTIISAAGSPVDHLRGVGSAQQVIEVAASRYGTSYATLTAYRTTSSGWVRSYGPWPARLGRNGFAAPGKKQDGD